MGINFKGVIKGTIFAILVTFVIILILARFRILQA